jgi:hypothetical protein
MEEKLITIFQQNRNVLACKAQFLQECSSMPPNISNQAMQIFSYKGNGILKKSVFKCAHAALASRSGEPVHVCPQNRCYFIALTSRKSAGSRVPLSKGRDSPVRTSTEN